MSACGPHRVAHSVIGPFHGRASIHHPSEARLHFINSRLCCAAALPLLTSFLFPSETAWLMLVHSAWRGGSGWWRWVDFTTTTTYIAMPVATAVTSRAGGRSLAMALRT